MPNRDIIVIGGSAGGLEALNELLPGLPVPLTAAVFVVLHTSPSPGSRLAMVLSRKTDLRVSFATDGEPITMGRVYVAPPDHHLLIADGHLRVTRGPKENRNRPAIDPLFRSAALAYGSRVIGVVLSGMLDDGTAGLWTIKDRGGLAIVQDPAEAVYSMMPASAIQNVVVDWQRSAAAIGSLLARVVREPMVVKGGRAMADIVEAEVRIAAEDNPVEKGSLELGELTPYTCPDCQGVLSQIREGGVLRFRCHTGHAYSAASLLETLSGSIEDMLWSVVRGLEERVMLLRHTATHLEERGDRDVAAEVSMKADVEEKRAARMRQLAIEGQEIGRSPDFELAATDRPGN